MTKPTANPLFDRLLDRPEQSRRIVRGGLIAKIKRFAGRLPFIEPLLAAYYCARDPLTPATAKAILMAALAYFVLPFDLIPDMLAGLGLSDDTAVLMAAIGAVQAQIRPRHHAAAKRALWRMKHNVTRLDPDELGA
ncbi:MAG: YkvA family protein [Rhodothalassiaceae bacterium]